MQDEHVDAIAAAWLERTGAAPDALRAFLGASVPDVEAWALRRAGQQPEILALSARHLYRIAASQIEGRPAFGFDRWPYAEISVSLVEWGDAGGARRRWTLRMRDAALTIEAELDAPVELVMRELVERAS